jgi:glycosyltransferase involved in cell wall biosynthesis
MRKLKDTLVIIPIFNESRNIERVIDNINKNYKEADILVVNDGSTDKTGEVIQNKNIFVVNHLFNMGIGTSFETGCKFALRNGYEYIVRIDGDGQHDAVFIEKILLPIKNGEADISVGSRFLEESKHKTSPLRLIGIKVIALLLYLMTGKKVTDPTSGFCAMDKKAFEFFSENCVEDYPEPQILVYHKEFRIIEIPISVTKREYGASSITPLKSAYYMIKVLLSLILHIFRKGES